MRKILRLALLLLFPLLSFAQDWAVVGSGGTQLWGPPVNLKASCLASTSTVSLTADCMLTDDGTTAVILRGVSFVADMSVSGPAANGRDQAGSFATSTWIYLHAIWGSGNTVAGLWSLSSTAPTLPTGYTQYALVSAAYTASSGVNLAYAWTQVGRIVSYLATGSTGLTALVSGHAVTLTSVSLSAGVPPLSIAAYVSSAIIPNSAGNKLALSTNTATGFGSLFGQVTGIFMGTTTQRVPLTSTQAIFYSVTNASDAGNLNIYGWEF